MVDSHLLRQKDTNPDIFMGQIGDVNERSRPAGSDGVGTNYRAHVPSEGRHLVEMKTQ